MPNTLEEALLDLERCGELVRISGEVDPYLEAAAIHRRVFAAKGPALLFENIKGSPFRAASNIFGTYERTCWIFRKTLPQLKELIALKYHPAAALKSPLSTAKSLALAAHALPIRKSCSSHWQEVSAHALPQLQFWPKDGGAFMTLPQVYTEHPSHPKVMKSNLGMYRVQMSGGEYQADHEMGLHYQLHRTIGQHHAAARAQNKALPVSIFVGGPPAHSVAAVMPLPDHISEVLFAGMLARRNFRYSRWENHVVSEDADFVIMGEISPGNLPEGPFGDHLGYYSLTHPMPVLKIKKILAKPNSIWPFTVVGRPPAEDSFFGKLIHDLTADAVSQVIPGVTKIHAVDEAGVHPLLLAVAHERYVPYEERKPREILTAANALLGFGQVSLAKYLFITAEEDARELNIYDSEKFLAFMLERLDFSRDLHFQTMTTIDTLDYSGTGLNEGSKLILAALGEKKRNLKTEISGLKHDLAEGLSNPRLISPGIIAVEAAPFPSYDTVEHQIATWLPSLKQNFALEDFPLIILVNNSEFSSKNYANFLWETFTRSNPSHDVYGIDSFMHFKHWGCHGSLIIDAREKPHHAPMLEEDPNILNRIERFFVPGAPLAKWR